MRTTDRVRVPLALAAALFLQAAAAQGERCAPTPPDSEGPYYTKGAPARASLVEPGSKGARLLLSGRVLGPDCKPVAGAVLDFWQTDETGDYDHVGFRSRGVVTADAQGRYRVETVLPAEYPGRPRHIHVKVRPPKGRELTTQLYFPGESRGANPALVVKLAPAGTPREASFDFVLR